MLRKNVFLLTCFFQTQIKEVLKLIFKSTFQPIEICKVLVWFGDHTIIRTYFLHCVTL